MDWTWVRGNGLTEPMEEARGALRQGAQAGDAATDHREGRPPVQAGRHRRLGHLHADVGCRAHQRSLLRPLRVQGRPRRPCRGRRPARRSRGGTLRPGRPGLEDVIREYLSPEHRDHPGLGCPSAALLDEIGVAGTGPSRPTPTARGTSWRRSPPAWHLRIRSPLAARPSGSSPCWWGRCNCPAPSPTGSSPMRSLNRESRTPSLS